MSSIPNRLDSPVRMISHLSTVIAHLSTITSITHLTELLQAIVTDTPQLIEAVGCSIYLRPDWVPTFNGDLIDVDRRRVKADQLREPFVVLAAANRSSAGPLQIKEAAKEAVQGVGFDLLIVCGFAFDPHVAEEVKRYGKLTVLTAHES